MFRSGTVAILATVAVLLGASGCFQRHDPAPGGGETRAAAIAPPRAEMHAATTLHHSPAEKLFARLAAGADGSLYVGWIEPGQNGSRLMTRRLSPQGWLPAVAGVQMPSPAALTGTAVDPGGQLHALFITRQGKVQRVFYARQNGHGWPPPRELTVANLSAYGARLAVGRGGTLHTTWYAAQEHNAAVIYRTGNGADWGDGQRVSPRDPKTTFWSPDLAVGPDGTLHLTYFTLSKGGTAAFYTHKAPGGGWQEARRLSAGHKFATAPRIALDGAGNPHVVWTGGTDNRTLFHTFRRDGRWSAPAVLATRNHPPHNVALAVDDRGVVYAAWREDNAGGGSDIFLCRGRDGQWAPPVNVSHTAGASYGVTARVVGTSLHLAWTDSAPDGKSSEIRWLPVPVTAPQG